MCKPLWFLPFFAIAFTQLAHADNDQDCDSEIVEAVARWAGIDGKLVSWNEEGGLIAAAACKTMPNAPGTTIAAIAFDTNSEGRFRWEIDGRKMEVIALVEAGKVVAANRSTIVEDAALNVGYYRIDTARYILSKDVRAFGVVFYSGGSISRTVDAGFEKKLTLWIREGEHLRAILDTYLYEFIRIGRPSYHCERIARADMTIGVEKTSSHGFADLSITAHVEEYVCGEDERDSLTESTIRKVLKYDGKSYGVGFLWWHPEEW